MTAGIGVAVFPSKGKPYFLIGTESKKIVMMEDGSFLINQKANKIQVTTSNKIIASAGRVPYELNEALQGNLSHLNLSIKEIAIQMKDIIEKGFTEYLPNLHQELPFLRSATIIGGIENGYPTFAYLQMDTRENNSSLNIIQVKKTGFVPCFIGKVDSDLQKSFYNEVQRENPTYNRIQMEKIITKYIKETARLYPKTCNQLVKLKYIY